MTEQQTFDRIGADGAETATTQVPNDVKPTDKVLIAVIPGWDESKGITLTLSHPLNQKDRDHLGLPGGDGSTEVGQKVKVNKNGAKSLIGAGYATVDPEDNAAVSEALAGNAPAAAGTSDTSTNVGVEPGLDEPVVVEPSAAPDEQVEGEAPTDTPQPVTEPATGEQTDADKTAESSTTTTGRSRGGRTS